MIQINRPVLNDPLARQLLQRANNARQELIDSFASYVRPRIEDSIYKAFKEYLFTAFCNKCAYCESIVTNAQPGDVEHYRPKNRVSDDTLKPIKATYEGWGEIDHLGYFWLAYEWNNLLPSCADCNRYRKHFDGNGYGKADRFPVDGERACLPGEEFKEKALLIDPTKVNPEDHLIFFPEGHVRALTREGEVTIALLGLNDREVLVQQRKEQYKASYRAYVEYIERVRSGDALQILELRQEVNEIYCGNKQYSAFGRLAIKVIRSKYADEGIHLPMPIEDPTMRNAATDLPLDFVTKG